MERARGQLRQNRIGAKAVLAGLAVLITVCFSPLLLHFLVQDDFRLAYLATQSLREELGKVFGPEPYHIRPLTKFLYFAVTYPIFGLHAFPYHLVSLLIHLANTTMIYLLLRALRVTSAASLVGAGFFGLSVAFFEAVGWISCIQQLAGAFFFFMSLLLSLAALRDRSAKKIAGAAFAYLLAVLSVEQPFLAPFVAVLVAALGLGRDVRFSIRSAARVLWPQFMIFALYTALRVWKDVPDVGRTRFEYGKNIVENIVTYLGAMFDFWPDLAAVITLNPLAVKTPHVVLAALLVYHLARRRYGAVLFSIVFVMATLLPALFLVRHYYYYHTYIPALGTIYLLALAADDLFVLGRRWLRSEGRRLAAASLAIVAVFALSAAKVRENDERAHYEMDENKSSFVVRRALIAERFYRCMKIKAGDMAGVRTVHLFWGRPGLTDKIGRHSDVVWALASGYALNLFFDDPRLEVSVDFPKSHPRELLAPDSRIFIYDRRGACYTYEEVLGDAP